MELDAGVEVQIKAFQKEVTRAVEEACSRLSEDLQRALTDRACLQDRVNTLERCNTELQEALQRKDSELLIQESSNERTRQANSKLKDHARRLRNWILARENWTMQDLRIKIDAELPVNGSFSSSRRDAVDSPPLEANSNSIESDLLHRPPKQQGKNLDVSGKPSTVSLHPASDPTTDSTESASAVPSQDSLTAPPGALNESDSDVPEVLFERKLKRKHSTRNEPYIKPEPLSPPKSAAEPVALDLDDVNVPLKKQCRGSRMSREEHRTKRQRTSEIFVDPHDKFLRHQREDAPVSGSAHQYQGHRPATDPQVRGELKSSKDRSTQAWHIVQDAASTPSLSNSRPSKALQEKNPNPRAPRHREINRADLKRKVHDLMDHRIAILGEDGDATGSENYPHIGDNSPALDYLLKPRPQSSLQSVTPPADYFPLSDQYKHNHMPEKTETPRAFSNKMTPRRTPVSASSSKEVGDTLRRRGPADLTLEDFRPNPARNNGLKFAFNEVIRKRDQRQCLPGCTKPECCATKFNQVVQIGGFITPSRTNLGDVLRNEDNETRADEAMLRNYLGDDAEKLDYMSNAEREDHLLKAKALAFGQLHAKHRHLHERPTSPPGFWRTDMPTSQEVVKDKEDADILRRRKVDERWREAMKPNGRWLFRDESLP